ncbi:MAG: recombination protein RecR [Rhodospirillaceae bacterium]|nr:MAG: recombination protein RecR [Rhodospirillaceae bacterium]
MAGPAIERLIQTLARLPGFGPRSARRAALALIKKRSALLTPLVQALTDVAERVRFCSVCGNVDTDDPCVLCTDSRRDSSVLCVVREVADLWALERSGAFRGRYHVLGGVLSALDGVGPDDLRLESLIVRAETSGVREVVLALGATVEGQTTAHAIAERLKETRVHISALAHGVPVGGELDYLDDGTLLTALRARRPFANSGE